MSLSLALSPPPSHPLSFSLSFSEDSQPKNHAGTRCGITLFALASLPLTYFLHFLSHGAPASGCRQPTAHAHASSLCAAPLLFL